MLLMYFLSSLKEREREREIEIEIKKNFLFEDKIRNKI